jgi:hypothetical protein
MRLSTGCPFCLDIGALMTFCPSAATGGVNIGWESVVLQHGAVGEVVVGVAITTIFLSRI